MSQRFLFFCALGHRPHIGSPTLSPHYDSYIHLSCQVGFSSKPGKDDLHNPGSTPNSFKEKEITAILIRPIAKGHMTLLWMDSPHQTNPVPASLGKTVACSRSNSETLKRPRTTSTSSCTATGTTSIGSVEAASLLMSSPRQMLHASLRAPAPLNGRTVRTASASATHAPYNSTTRDRHRHMYHTIAIDRYKLTCISLQLWTSVFLVVPGPVARVK